jgi:hypothetical protein
MTRSAGLTRLDRALSSASERRLVALGIGLATASLLAGYALGRSPAGVLSVLVLGVSWLAGQRRGWLWVDDAGLAVYSGAAAAGMWLGLGAGWMLVGIGAALSAWDLAAFVRWLRDLRPAEKATPLLRRHLGRLLVVDALGLLLAGVALEMRLRLSLALMLLLGVVLVVGVSWAVRFLRRES